MATNGNSSNGAITNGGHSNGGHSNGGHSNGTHSNETASNEPAISLFSDTALDDEDACMQVALSAYKSRMINGNRNFLIERVEAIQSLNYPTEKKKLNLMARFWFHEKKWPRQPANWFGAHMRPHNINEQTNIEENVTTLDEVRDLPHPNMDGLLPPRFPSIEAISVVVETMEEVAKFHADHDDSISRLTGQPGTDIDFQIPDEFRYFLRYAKGVKEPDFRYEGICEWAIFDQMDVSDTSESVDLREVARAHLEAVLVTLDESFVLRTIAKLQVKAGFHAGLAEWHDHDKWASYYLFCRRNYRDENVKNDGWAWRIVFENVMPENRPFHSTLHVFDDIADFLKWHTGWIGSPDLDEKVAELLDWSSDDESDSYDNQEVLHAIPGAPS